MHTVIHRYEWYQFSLFILSFFCIRSYLLVWPISTTLDTRSQCGVLVLLLFRIVWFDLSLFFQRFCGKRWMWNSTFLMIWFAQVTPNSTRVTVAASGECKFSLISSLGFSHVSIHKSYRNVLSESGDKMRFGRIFRCHTKRTKEASSEQHKRNRIAICLHQPSTNKQYNKLPTKNVKLQPKVFSSLALCLQENLIQRNYSVILAQFYEFSFILFWNVFF